VDLCSRGPGEYRSSQIRMIVDRSLRNLGLGKGTIVAAGRAARISSQGDTV